uniref:Putative secreted protein n=1 Tax=Anopheles triannulatus TaxID=58253 RepID=A0A2M4B2R9_9DIPT
MWICVGTVGICSAVVTSARKTTVNPTATSRQTISGLLRQRFPLVNVRILRPRNRIPVLHRRRSTCANFARLALPPTHAHTQINTHSHAGNALGSAQSLLCATHKGPGKRPPFLGTVRSARISRSLRPLLLHSFDLIRGVVGELAIPFSGKR